MKQLFILILFAIANTSFSYSPPDSCLKTFDIPEDDTFENPFDVRVDSCYGSGTFGEFYAKGYFSVFFEYNIIPRSGLFPEDTLIEYSISDIDTIYSDAIKEFQNLESQYGSFKFIEQKPHRPDTTTLLTRKLFINFDNFVNIESADESIQNINIVTSVGFASWFRILSNIKGIEENSSLSYNVQSDILNIHNVLGNNSDLKIYNINGNEVLNQKIPPGSTSISLRDLNSGIYFIFLNGNINKILK